MSCNKTGSSDKKEPYIFSQEIDTVIKLGNNYLKIQTIAQNLDVPWEIAYGSDDWIWITEQRGLVSRIHPESGEKMELLNIEEKVFHRRSTGLLGMALHPDLSNHPYVYLNYTFEEGDEIGSRLVRYTFEQDSLVSPEVLYEVDGSTGHNGSRVTISNDLKLFWATGDALKSDHAQNPDSPNGKILRLNIDGSIPSDNPFAGNPVWSWGHRNHQGLVMSDSGVLYTSEHGEADDDEVNLIEPKKNYGWPNVTGYIDTPEEEIYTRDSVITPPLKAWTPTIAPAGLDYYNSDAIASWQNSLILTTLKENDVRILKLNEAGDRILSESIVIDNRYGRIRDLCISPEGDLYISTSNHDWNPRDPFPMPEDDRILRVSLADEMEVAAFIEKSGVDISKQRQLAQSDSEEATGVPGQSLYSNYCASCHKDNGKGVQGSFPSLENSKLVSENKQALIEVALHGKQSSADLNENLYEGVMPGFNFLSDQEVADILTYVRTSFGNNGGEIYPQDISELR